MPLMTGTIRNSLADKALAVSKSFSLRNPSHPSVQPRQWEDACHRLAHKIYLEPSLLHPFADVRCGVPPTMLRRLIKMTPQVSMGWNGQQKESAGDKQLSH